jgi:hypothetical protein
MMWSIPKSPLQRLLLSLMARDQKTDENRGQRFSLAELQEEFQRLEIAFDDIEVRRALHYLIEEEVIDIDAEGHFYSIEVGLLRAWLQKERMLNHVIANEPLLLEHVDMEQAD